jgi:hypothetical protein
MTISRITITRTVVYDRITWREGGDDDAFRQYVGLCEDIDFNDPQTFTQTTSINYSDD